MRLLRKILYWTLGTVLVLYVVVCAFYYFRQDKMLFPGVALPPGYVYHFGDRFEERTITMIDGKTLDGLLFKADSSKGLIFYLHGNGDNLAHWGKIAHYYTDLNYDIFLLDYRGYGKSQGHMSGEGQLFSDVQTAYDDLRKTYPEQAIVILGYSIGTGPAAMLAARNHPKMLILQAPYYSMHEMSVQYIPWLSATFPSWLMKYPLQSYTYVQQTKAPIVLFHGNKDEVIYIEQSYKLKSFLKPGDRFIVLDGQGHNHFTDNAEYLRDLKEIL